MLSLETGKKDVTLFPHWALNMLLVWWYDVPFRWLFYKVLLSQVQGLASVKAKEEIRFTLPALPESISGVKSLRSSWKDMPFYVKSNNFLAVPFTFPKEIFNLDRSLRPTSPTGSVLQNKASWVLTFYFLLSGLSCPFFSWHGPLVGFEKLSRTSPGTQVYIDYKLFSSSQYLSYFHYLFLFSIRAHLFQKSWIQSDKMMLRHMSYQDKEQGHHQVVPS